MISAPAETAQTRRAVSSRREIAAGSTKLGVPPPKKIVAISFPAKRGPQSSSSRTAARSQSPARSSIPAYELKSQYAHLTVQNGTWM